MRMFVKRVPFFLLLFWGFAGLGACSGGQGGSQSDKNKAFSDSLCNSTGGSSALCADIKGKVLASIGSPSAVFMRLETNEGILVDKKDSSRIFGNAESWEMGWKISLPEINKIRDFEVSADLQTKDQKSLRYTLAFYDQEGRRITQPESFVGKQASLLVQRGMAKKLMASVKISTLKKIIGLIYFGGSGMKSSPNYALIPPIEVTLASADSSVGEGKTSEMEK